MKGKFILTCVFSKGNVNNLKKNPTKDLQRVNKIWKCHHGALGGV